MMPRDFPHALRLPVFAAPMFLISGPDLVVAACKAGIVGAFPVHNCRTAPELDRWMADIKDGLEAARAARPTVAPAPWAVNLMTHSTNKSLGRDLELVERHRPPIVITALGSPKPAIEAVHSYGGLVFADVISIKLARKAVDAGADGLACICAGAGGHTGHLSPFAFVSAVREFFDGYIVVGGGIADGAGVAGAIAAGADFVYMGTRFIAAAESLAVAAYKQMLIECGSDDLVISAAISGTPASWLKPSLLACGYDDEALRGTVARDYSGGTDAHKRWRDTWAAGQGLHVIGAVEPTAVIVDRLAREYADAAARFRRMSPAGAA
jgi:nitronate monooxygenase